MISYLNYYIITSETGGREIPRSHSPLLTRLRSSLTDYRERDDRFLVYGSKSLKQAEIGSPEDVGRGGLSPPLSVPSVPDVSFCSEC